MVGSADDMSEYTLLVWIEIEKALSKAQRDLRRGVLPRDVQARLPYARAEGSLRRDMLAMYQAGRLVRVGGLGARRGYRLPSRVERVAWGCNAGQWPAGSEELGLWAA
jgi:hypothetical protein